MRIPLPSLALVLAALAGCGTPQPVGQRVPDPAASAGVAPFDSAAFNFLVVGDWGRNGFFNQSDVADGMGVVGEKIRSRFTISTGDNFYLDGVRSLEDPKWERSYENIYTAASLQSRWYVTLGNHDWLGDVPAQIEYTDRSERWYLPAQYYAETVTLDDDETEVLFVFIDTTPLAYPPEYKRRFSDTGDWDPEGQLEWIEEDPGGVRRAVEDRRGATTRSTSARSGTPTTSGWWSRWCPSSSGRASRCTSPATTTTSSTTGRRARRSTTSSPARAR